MRADRSRRFYPYFAISSPRSPKLGLLAGDGAGKISQSHPCLSLSSAYYRNYKLHEADPSVKESYEYDEWDGRIVPLREMLIT
jgi:hypothetical protein